MGVKENKKIYVANELKKRLLLPFAGEHSKFPLYKRSETYNQNNSYNEPVYSDSLWDKEVEKTYTSPRNIRKIIISKNAIYNVFWVPYIYNNKKANTKIKVNIGLGNTKVKPENLIFNERSILNKLNRWALPNLEEVYFDLTGLCSSSLSTLDLNSVDSAELNRVFDGTVHNVFYGEHKSRYKRLKRIVFIGSIDENTANLLIPGNVSSDIIASLSDDNIVIEHKGDIIDTNVYNTNFSCSPNLYQFDREHLVDYFRDLTRELDKSKVKPNLLDGEEQDKNKVEYTDLEKLLEHLSKSIKNTDILVGALQVLGKDFVASINPSLLVELRDSINKAYGSSSFYIG